VILDAIHTTARLCENTSLPCGNEPHFFSFQLSQISGGHLNSFATFCVPVRLFVSSSFCAPLLFGANFPAYIYILHQGRQSDLFLRVGGALFATKDGWLCEISWISSLRLVFIFVWSAFACLFFFLSLGGCLINLFISLFFACVLYML
jgi:hypothetical protein